MNFNILEPVLDSVFNDDWTAEEVGSRKEIVIYTGYRFVNDELDGEIRKLTRRELTEG